jgi:hypothetical protein
MGSERDQSGRFRATVRWSWLAPVIRLLGGPAEAARHLGRDRSTIYRWITGERPMPAWAAERLLRRARDAATELLSIIIPELEKQQRQGEQRAAQGAGRRLKWTPDLGPLVKV